MHAILALLMLNGDVDWSAYGALTPKSDLNSKAAFEATPILVGGTLYLSTPFNQVIALDPVTGQQRWKYDPYVDRTRDYSEVASRGVSTWLDSQRQSGDPCRRRIIVGTIDARLIAVDAAAGKGCDGFSQIDLTKDVGLKEKGQYQVTSPPAIVGDLVVTGSSIGDGRRADSERGIVRAFHARTGKLVWSFDPLPASLKNAGAANAWSALAADPERDMVFVPTGSASPDFYGGERPGNNGYANSVVAIRASTGQVLWAFQVVHHDLWDYDVASQPALVTWKGIPAIAVTTKIGHFFVLDRATGKSLLPIEERPVPQSKVPGAFALP
jgi:quinoprotein glucose dehydrogenase